ncbi:ATP-binding protein [Halosimplex sp. XZYJT29]
MADGDRLPQLLENLFRNALEHGGDDVRITVGDLDDGFYVADDGPGIAGDVRDRVFDSGFSTSPREHGIRPRHRRADRRSTRLGRRRHRERGRRRTVRDHRRRLRTADQRRRLIETRPRQAAKSAVARRHL